jgi:hypothetical protein
MKHLFASACFFFLVHVQYGQSRSCDSCFFEIGLNATAFVNQYLNFGNDTGILSSPYMLTLEKRMGGFGIRGGFGMDGLRDQQDPPNGSPTSPDLNISRLSLNVRSGLVFYQPLSNRWDLKYGCDIAYAYNSDKNWTEVTNFFGEKVRNTNHDLEWSLGLNPFIFAQFHLSRKFSLATELLLDISYRQLVEKTESTEFPEFDTRQETIGFRYQLKPPVALFFIFRI